LTSSLCDRFAFAATIMSEGKECVKRVSSNLNAPSCAGRANQIDRSSGEVSSYKRQQDVYRFNKLDLSIRYPATTLFPAECSRKSFRNHLCSRVLPWADTEENRTRVSTCIVTQSEAVLLQALYL